MNFLIVIYYVVVVYGQVFCVVLQMGLEMFEFIDPRLDSFEVFIHVLAVLYGTRKLLNDFTDPFKCQEQFPTATQFKSLKDICEERFTFMVEVMNHSKIICPNNAT